MRNVITTVFIFMINAVQLHAQEVEKAIQKGNDLYKQQQYQQAEAVYNEVLEKEPSNNIAKYNRAITLHKQAKPDEAIKAFYDLAFKTENKEIKEKSYYNKGAVLSTQKR